jgi:predicted transposase/invertase (TIGR01784 family)
LEYLCKHQSTTKFTQSLETAVYRNKNNQNWRQDYMTLAYNLSLAAEKAFENGFSAGEERGISIGLSQGAQQKAVETAKNALTMNLSIEQVATLTGLSVEEIEKL